MCARKQSGRAIGRLLEREHSIDEVGRHAGDLVCERAEIGGRMTVAEICDVGQQRPFLRRRRREAVRQPVVMSRCFSIQARRK